MKLWLDDYRDPADYDKEDWYWAKTAAGAIMVLKTGKVDEASLDHDLAEEHYPWNCSAIEECVGTGYDVVCWMEEHNVWPINGVKVHSMNPIGRRRMEQVIERAYEKLSNRLSQRNEGRNPNEPSLEKC